MTSTPTLLWFRRDLRLSDHPALVAAVANSGPVIPVVINDPVVQSWGAAPRWRWQLGVAALRDALRAQGCDLVCRRGKAIDVLRDLVAETGARAVYWSRAYDPDQQARDTEVKKALKEQGLDAQSFTGHLLFEPWDVATKTGAFYKVYTPMWKSVKDRELRAPLAAPSHIPAPESWPTSDDPMAWDLGDAMRRGAPIVQPHLILGEAAAQTRLEHFASGALAQYDTGRDLPWQDGTSKLSQNLALGEISPFQCWHRGQRALQDGAAGAETFLKELVWREFAYHLLHHTPRIATDNWRPEWDGFPWNTDVNHPHVVAWTQGRTGIQFVDAAMREMYVTGLMHNRGRMIVASYLCKHLLSHWKIGKAWFDDHLVDWDPASNAMGWQWSAGSGPDATPYFRVFNPVTQLDKFDKNRSYVGAWIAEGRSKPAAEALSYFDAVPLAWGLSPDDSYPSPIVPADEGRKRALDAYQQRGF